jgi:predicted translin family RNA/ssDNA-binding protein
MSNQEKIIELSEQSVQKDFELIKLCSQLKPEDQKEFLPKIEKSLEKTKQLLQSLKQSA